MKASSIVPMTVQAVANPVKQPKTVDSWIMTEMPDVEDLMQELPSEVQEAIARSRVPDESLAVDLPDFVRIAYSLVDIPVHENVIESLHLLFSLFLEFRDSQHFNQQSVMPLPVTNVHKIE
eukprot:Clim_evm92s88 gene=Clim_evmTU92s88